MSPVHRTTEKEAVMTRTPAGARKSDETGKDCRFVSFLLLPSLKGEGRRNAAGAVKVEEDSDRKSSPVLRD